MPAYWANILTIYGIYATVYPNVGFKQEKINGFRQRKRGKNRYQIRQKR